MDWTGIRKVQIQEAYEELRRQNSVLLKRLNDRDEQIARLLDLSESLIKKLEEIFGGSLAEILEKSKGGMR